jgi:tetratricopeptide (TPR) repeat protein
VEDRHTEITEGAGLEESRLNEEFIEWLRQWSTPLLVFFAVLALGFFGMRKLEQAKIDKVNRAFQEMELAAAGPNPSPESLKQVAEEFGKIRAVPHLSRLKAADIYLQAVRSGLRVGVVYDPTNPEQSDLNEDGTVKDPEFLLTDEDRASYLSEAESLYRRVAEDTDGEKFGVWHAIPAHYGLATVAECRGDFDEARRQYQRVIELDKSAGGKDQAEIAQHRIDTLDEIQNVPPLYSMTELPPLPEPPAPPTAETPGGEGDASAVEPGGEVGPSPEGAGDGADEGGAAGAGGGDGGGGGADAPPDTPGDG